MSGKFCALLLGLLWQIVPVMAQSKAIPQKVFYRRDVPKNVAQAISREAGVRRLFWGTFVPKTGAPPMGVQLYGAKEGVTLELWQKNLQRFVRVNRVKGLYSGLTPSGTKFSAEFYWLDRAQKTIPILVISQITYENLLPGEYRGIAVVSLTLGWNKLPCVQHFTNGDSNAGVDTFSVSYGNHNYLELTVTSGDISGTIDTYRWEGKRFSVFKRETYDSTNG